MNLTYIILPNGSAVQFDINTSATTTTINRASSGSSGMSLYTEIYNGPSPSLFIDDGEGLPGPLPTNVLYYYQITDSNGFSDTIGPLNVSSRLVLNRLDLTELLTKLLWGGLSSLELPVGLVKVQRVLHAMPLTGQPTLPIVTINLDLFQTKEIPIGQNIPVIHQNTWNIESLATWRFVIAVMSNSPTEREFYRDAIISLLHSFMYAPLNTLGKNIRHSVQSTNGQSSGGAKDPGFYYSEIAFEFTGTFSIQLNVAEPMILDIITELETSVY